MKLFTVDKEYNLELITDELLLIPEFKATLEKKRNITKEDPKGTKFTRAFREWTFIWLYYDYESLFFKFTEKDKYDESIVASKLTEEELNDPVFRKACRKYAAIQDNVPSFRILKSVTDAVEKLRLYFETVDPTERDEETGKLVYSAKELIANITATKTLLASVKELNDFVKGEMVEAGKDIRGGQKLGLFDEEE